MLKSSVSIDRSGSILLEELVPVTATSVSFPCQNKRLNTDLMVVWQRPNFHSSPSIERALDAALEVSGIIKDKIDLYDFYSYYFLLLGHLHMLTIGTAASRSYPSWLAIISNCPLRDFQSPSLEGSPLSAVPAITTLCMQVSIAYL